MDCCNYMQYRSHQAYGFGQGYYDHLPDYGHGGDFYGQHVYHDFYGSPYYPQHWQQASQVSPFTDYVYNPKEARIRKAMREANRDRSIGASPMLPRPGSRLPTHADWAQAQDDQLMMCSMDSMRRIDTPICSYPLPNTENDQYMSPMNGYNKIDPPSMMQNYMQPSPLAQLQQTTEMWHPYQDNMRPRPLGTPFHHPMMSEMPQASYHSQEPMQEAPTNLIMEKPRQSPGCAQQSIAESVPPRGPSEDTTMTPPIPDMNQMEHHQNTQYLEPKISPERMQGGFLEEGHRQDNQFVPAPDRLMGCAPFEPAPKIEPVTVTKKPRGRPPTKKNQQPPPPPPKPLPDFNEAFGSTERGRFLSPPDPRLNKNYLDVLFENDTSFMKFDDFQI